MPQKFQVISSIISFTFNVVYLPSVFHIIPTKLLIRYIYDHPIRHKENEQAELTRGRVDSGAELVSGRVDPLPFQWETRLCRVSHWNGGPEGSDFPVPL